MSVAKPWQEPVGHNRLTRYDIARWLRELAAMRVIQKSEAADLAEWIRIGISCGHAPWPSES